jgi:hypothetical protein
MAEPSSASMTRLFSDLIGRSVSFSEQLHPATAKTAQLFCTYLIKPMDSTRIIRADLSVLSSLAGALIGLSPETIQQRVAEPQLDEALRDAIHEVMNIASRVVSTEHRAVFEGMYTDSASLPADARNTLRDPCYSSHFSVKIDGYEGGTVSLLAPF